MSRRRLSGVWPILVTPFDAAGEIDDESLAALVRGTLAVGVDGVVALGVNAEASKLSDDERERIVGIVGDVCRDVDRPFIVTVSHGGTKVAAERARAAGRAGAWAVMAAPPPFAKPGTALVEHYRAIGAEGLPGLGLAHMKEVLRRRGLIRHAGLRAPGSVLDPASLRELDRVLAQVPSVEEPGTRRGGQVS